MKKSIIFVTTLVAFGAMSFAQNATPPAVNNTPETPKVQTPAPEKKAPAKKKEMKKMKKADIFFGQITAIDATKNEITVKGKKDQAEKTFALDAKQIAGLKAGQEVKIKLKDDKVENIKEIKHQAKKAEHKAMKAEKKAEKSAEKPADTPKTN